MDSPHASTTARSATAGLLAVAMLGIVSCTDAVTEPVPGTPPVAVANNLPDVDLVFVGDDGDGPNIFGFRQRDGALFKVTLKTSSYFGVSLSPTGGTVAVAAVREGCRRIFTINLETREEKAVSHPRDDSCVYSPRWSPDGSKIVYNNLRGGFHLVIVNADGTQRQVLVPPAGVNILAYPHGWHPDGRIIFHRAVLGGEGGRTAYVINADGSGEELLFGRDGDITPQWSPNKSRVAFIRNVDDVLSLWVADADGSNAVRISDASSHAALEFSGSATDYVKDFWSPDGAWIAMSRDSAWHTAVDVVRSDGSETHRLTGFRKTTQFMGWTKDGRVSFRSDSAGSPRLYTAWPDGTGLQEVALPVQFVGNAIWRRAFVGQER